MTGSTPIKLHSGIARIAFSAGLLLVDLLLPRWTLGQDLEVQPVPAAEIHLPRGNEEFHALHSTNGVARRFEMYSPHSAEALRELKAMGFTQVILDWPNLHADAAAAGLDVVLSNWWTDKTPPAEIDRVLEFAKQIDRQRLSGISLMDEPDRNSPDTPFGFYVDLYEKLRPRVVETLPGVRLEISHWGPLARWDQRYYDYFSFLYEAADVMRIMPYPDLNEGPLADVSLMMLRSKECMKLAEREIPVVVILQTWVLPPRNELPTVPELRVMAFQALLGGAETVSFFDHNPQVWSQTEGFTPGFKDLMRELTQSSARWASAKVTWQIQSDGIFRAEIAQPDGARSLVLINTNRQPVAGLEGLQVLEREEPRAAVPLECVPCSPAREVCPPAVRSVAPARRLVPRSVHQPSRPLLRGRLRRIFRG